MLKTVKFVHTADIHLGMENYGKIDPKTGLNSRLGDFLRSFDAIINYALREKADLFIFSGDAYKNRDPSPTYERAFAERIYKLSAANIPVVLLVGNHDLPNTAGKANTLDIYDALQIPNVYVSRKSEIIEIPLSLAPCRLLQIITLPWITKSQFLTKEEYTNKSQEKTDQLMIQKISETIKYLIAKVDPQCPTILAAHATVSGAVFGGERLVTLGSDVIIPLEILTNKKLDYIALGHLHKHQIISQNPPVIYPGSIERVDFGEEKEGRGFIAGKIKIDPASRKRTTDFKFISLPARTFLTIKVKIRDDDQNPTVTAVKEIEKYKREIKDAVVKVVIYLNEGKEGEIKENAIREKLKDAHFIAGINKIISQGQREKEAAGYSDELYTLQPLDMLGKYFVQKKINPVRVELLKEYTEKLIEEMGD